MLILSQLIIQVNYILFEFLFCRGFILLNTLIFYSGINKLLTIFSEMGKGFREVEIIFMSESLQYVLNEEKLLLCSNRSVYMQI